MSSTAARRSATTRVSPSARIPTMAWLRKPTCSGSVTATICMTPASRIFWTRWRTAASDRPDRLGDRPVGPASVLLQLLDDGLVDVVEESVGAERGGRRAHGRRSGRGTGTVDRTAAGVGSDREHARSSYSSSSGNQWRISMESVAGAKFISRKNLSAGRSSVTMTTQQLWSTVDRSVGAPVDRTIGEPGEGQ